MHNFNKVDATAIAEMVRSGVVNPETVSRHFLECIESREPSIKAFVSFDPDWVRDQSRGVGKG